MKKAEHTQSKDIKVSGHLEDIRGIYQMVMNWVDADGKRRRKYMSTGLAVKGNKKKAEDMLYETRKDLEEEIAGMPTGLSKLLFADFMEQWLEVIRKEVKPTTFGTYQMNVQKTIAPYFRKKGILLRDLTADDISYFYGEQLDRVKAMTVTKYHAHISKALKYAVEKELIEHSMMDRVKRPKPDRFVGKFLRQNEVIKLFETVQGHKLELGVILGAFYGLRRAEVLGIRWESIDFDANTITIEHTVIETSIDGKKVIIADDTTKSKSSFRTLPLVPAFRNKLLAVRDEQYRNQKLCGKSYNKKESEYIYTDPLGNRIKPNYLTCAFPEFLERNGFKRMRFHDLRHSCASLLLANGVPLKQIQEWLGHSDFAITANTYAHLDYSSKQASAQAMSWIDQTSLANTEKKAESEKSETTGKSKVSGGRPGGQRQKAVKTVK